jgi:fructose-bisphosphate aldolase class II
MIVPLPYLLAKAQEGAYALGYFEAWDSYSLEAVIEAAETGMLLSSLVLAV